MDTQRETDLSGLISVIRSNDFVVLDTETTAKVPSMARICQIAIIDSTGQPLFNTLVNPGMPIPNSYIHGIEDEHVAGEPTFADIAPYLSALLKDRTVVIYNASYDAAVLASEYHRTKNPYSAIHRRCAMLAYAEFKGHRDHYRNKPSWWKLTEAAAHIKYKLPAEMNPHSALADCLMTLAVCKHMAAAQEKD